MVHKNYGKDIQQLKTTSLDERITLKRYTLNTSTLYL